MNTGFRRNLVRSVLFGMDKFYVSLPSFTGTFL